MSGPSTTESTGERSMVTAARRRLPLVHFAVDSALWVIAIPLGVILRYDLDLAMARERDVGLAIIVAVALQGIVGVADGLYRRRWRYGSFDEVRMVAFTALVVGAILTVAWWNGSDGARAVPRSVPALAAGVCLLGQVAIRSAWRLYNEQRHRPDHSDVGSVVIVGAGDLGEQAVRLLRSTPTAPLAPVALVDDDPNKRRLRLHGIRVEGRIDDLAEVAARHHTTNVLVADGSTDPALIRRVDAIARGAGLDVLILPPVGQLIGMVDVDAIRPMKPEDLLGRRPAAIDPLAVSDYITGRRVLVTGAGGSIGGELCRQLVRFDPEVVVMVDHHESGLHATQLSIEGRSRLDDAALELADIRDAQRMNEVFARHHPDVVFHAAALKHLPLLERHAAEAWKTNVVGTHNVVEAALAHGVSRLVNVSTDKAADPTSTLGHTKRITERLTADASQRGTTTCVSVRFGNVLGSSGSVLETFAAQVAAGGPITLTHPDVTRYFMTVEEAARLTIYAGAIGESGEVLILDMGEPVRIRDVAVRSARRHDPPLDIVVTGLRRNEKLHESLMGATEQGTRRVHDLITHVEVPPLRLDHDVLAGRPPDAEHIARLSTSTTAGSAGRVEP